MSAERSLHKEPDRLDYLAEQLESMTGGDVEAEHSRADALLVEALRAIPTLPSYRDEQIDRLITAYEGVRKWYA